MGSTENPNYWYDDKKRLIKSNNDPDIWIEFYPDNGRAETPTSFAIHIDDRKIGFTFAEPRFGGIRPMDKETGLPSYVFGPFGLHIIWSKPTQRNLSRVNNKTARSSLSLKVFRFSPGVIRQMK